MLVGTTRGGRRLAVVVPGDGPADHSLGGAEKMTNNELNLNEMTEAELADYYNSTHDLSEFEGGEVVTVPETQPETRNVTISVRFSPSELADLEEQATAADMRLASFIRATVLAASEPPVDRAEVLDMITALRRKIETGQASPGRAFRQAAGNTGRRWAHSAQVGRTKTYTKTSAVKTSTKTAAKAAAKATRAATKDTPMN